MPIWPCPPTAVHLKDSRLLSVPVMDVSSLLTSRSPATFDCPPVRCALSLGCLSAQSCVERHDYHLSNINYHLGTTQSDQHPPRCPTVSRTQSRESRADTRARMPSLFEQCLRSPPSLGTMLPRLLYWSSSSSSDTQAYTSGPYSSQRSPSFHTPLAHG